MPHSPTVLALADEIVHTCLNNGEGICIRTVRQSDEERMRSGIAELTSHSRYLRFFSGQTMPPDPVIERLLDVDGHRHLAWGAILTGGSSHPAIGAVHVFRNDAGGPAGEFSVAIVDAYHGLGLARLLTAVILINCKVEQIACLDVHVLSENQAASSLVRSLGGEHRQTIAGVSEYTVEVGAGLNILRHQTNRSGLLKVFMQLDRYC
jgi:ribosomal protein S18 acetylase RimI-like enzyme